jgi:hypothetical protein
MPNTGDRRDQRRRGDPARAGDLPGSIAAITEELTAEQVARKALTKALMICIRYADSSADTEQAHAALALAAKLL